MKECQELTAAVKNHVVLDVVVGTTIDQRIVFADICRIWGGIINGMILAPTVFLEERAKINGKILCQQVFCDGTAKINGEVRAQKIYIKRGLSYDLLKVDNSVPIFGGK